MHHNTKHGFCTRTKGIHPFYRRWRDMLTRCTYPKFHQYHDYGGRGITVLWPDFQAFHADMFKSFEEHVAFHGVKDTTLDRIDPDGHYCKENCKWATRLQQRHNTRIPLYTITANGETRTVQEWAAKLGVRAAAIYSRINSYGFTPQEAVQTPFKSRVANVMVTYQNETKSLMQWVRELELNYARVKSRLKLGWSPEEAFDYPHQRPTGKPTRPKPSYNDKAGGE